MLEFVSFLQLVCIDVYIGIYFVRNEELLPVRHYFWNNDNKHLFYSVIFVLFYSIGI